MFVQNLQVVADLPNERTNMTLTTPSVAPRADLAGLKANLRANLTAELETLQLLAARLGLVSTMSELGDLFADCEAWGDLPEAWEPVAKSVQFSVPEM